jgi:hypothetical protein
VPWLAAAGTVAYRQLPGGRSSRTRRTIYGKQLLGRVQEAAVTLRAHRRNVVIWSSSGGRAGGHGIGALPRLTRPRRIRRYGRTGALLAVLSLMRMAGAVRRRWRPLLAGCVLTTAGVMLRSSPWGVVFVPGICCLLYAMLLPADHQRRAELQRELAAYSTPAQRSDLEATLDRYPDHLTRELRGILADQAVADSRHRIPGAGRGLMPHH